MEGKNEKDAERREEREEERRGRRGRTREKQVEGKKLGEERRRKVRVSLQ